MSPVAAGAGPRLPVVLVERGGVVAAGAFPALFPVTPVTAALGGVAAVAARDVVVVVLAASGGGAGRAPVPAGVAPVSVGGAVTTGAGGTSGGSCAAAAATGLASFVFWPSVM